MGRLKPFRVVVFRRRPRAWFVSDATVSQDKAVSDATVSDRTKLLGS